MKLFCSFNVLQDQKKSGGEGEIRTHGSLLDYEHLANAWFQPLTHFSVPMCAVFC
jgi:hypothetical protein